MKLIYIFLFIIITLVIYYLIRSIKVNKLDNQFALPFSPIKNRVHYYIHRVQLQPYFTIDNDTINFNNINKQIPFLYQNYIIHSKHNSNLDKLGDYWLKFINDMNSCLSISNKLKDYEYITHFSDWNFQRHTDDSSYNLPTICKVITQCNHSPITNQFITLPLEQDSFFYINSFIRNGKLEQDIPFYQKDNKLVWRGTNSGIYPINNCKSSRYDIIKRYRNHKECDFQFTNINYNYKPFECEEELYNGNWLSREELLKHRCIVSIEGNDRASNIYWALLSNSAVITNPFSTRSWFMEELLVPWIHYIPVKHDWSDLIEKWKWSCNHPEKTHKIAINGQQFMKQFSNIHLENEVIKQVLLWYGKHVKLKTHSKDKDKLKYYKNMI